MLSTLALMPDISVGSSPWRRSSEATILLAQVKPSVLMGIADLNDCIVFLRMMVSELIDQVAA